MMIKIDSFMKIELHVVGEKYFPFHIDNMCESVHGSDSDSSSGGSSSDV